MRDFKGMKRQRGRNRGSGGNSGKPQHNTNRAFDSNGPDGVKVRGAAQHVYEKYQQLARDAHTAGDRVLAENYLQHAEHYFRVMRAMQPQRPVSEIIGRDQFISGYDIDFEDESGQADTGDADSTEASGGDGGEPHDRFEPRRDEPRRDELRRDEPRRDERPRDDYRQRDDYRPRDERPREDRGQVDRNQGERNPSDRSGGDRSNRSYRDDRPRYNREDRPRTDIRAEASERPAIDPLTVVEPESIPLPSPVQASVLRADDGEVSHAPAFLQVRPAEPREEGGGEPRRTRRRRAPASFDAAEAPAPATNVEEV